MVYRITLKSNPKILLVALIVVATPVGALLTFLFLPPLVSVILTVVGGYLSYHLGKFFFTTLRSRISVSDEGPVFDLSAKETVRFEWAEITHAGLCSRTKGGRVAYVYNDTEDKLITVPDEYADFGGFVEELRSGTEVEDVSLAEDQTVQDYLREKIGPPEPAEPSDSEEPPVPEGESVVGEEPKDE